MHTNLLDQLKGGDRRMVRGVDKVVKQVLAQPELFPQLIEGMLSDEPLVRMRCADTVEKITAKHPDMLQPHKKTILRQIAKIEQQEVRWHVAQFISRLTLTSAERRLAVSLMLDYLTDKSKIVRTFAMQTLADLTIQDVKLKPKVIGVIEGQMVNGSPAMRARGKKLLAQLKSKRGA